MDSVLPLVLEISSPSTHFETLPRNLLNFIQANATLSALFQLKSLNTSKAPRTLNPQFFQSFYILTSIYRRLDIGSFIKH